MPLPERKLIDRIRHMAGRPRSAQLIAGIGDDAAVLALGQGLELLVTTDLTIENVHFRREWSAPTAVGSRALTRGLSDIAAMGGEPFAAFLSLGLPPKTPQKWIDRFLQGFLGLAQKHGVVLAGGDTSSSTSAVVADVMVLGKILRGKAILRSGAQPGDAIFVTGALGAASAGLRRFRSGARRAAKTESLPEPRIAVGRHLRENRLVTAMIDVSDGLSTDLSHLCEESGVGAAIMESAIPRAAGTTLEDALHGGEDYELLFTVPPGRKLPVQIAGVNVSPIGEIIRSGRHEARILSRGKWKPLASKGWEHFA